MWALINPNDDTIIEHFNRARAFRIGDIQYPATAFTDSDLLFQLDILPVRRVQLNSPEDNHGWTSANQYVVNADHVRLEVTWAEDEDGQAQRDARDAKLADRTARAAFDTRRGLLEDFLYLKGYWTEHQLTGADLIEFGDSQP